MKKARQGQCILGWLIASWMICRTASGQSDDSPPRPAPPPFKQLRYDESYTYLREPTGRGEWPDVIKFIPFTATGESYLTLGGEIRERYEYYHNSRWGAGPQDENGYWLQRYMV